jgi:hypothetical protein
LLKNFSSPAEKKDSFNQNEGGTRTHFGFSSRQLLRICRALHQPVYKRTVQSVYTHYIFNPCLTNMSALKRTLYFFEPLRGLCAPAFGVVFSAQRGRTRREGASDLLGGENKWGAAALKTLPLPRVRVV